jgi:hypothetical protein
MPQLDIASGVDSGVVAISPSLDSLNFVTYVWLKIGNTVRGGGVRAHFSPGPS